jgi:hypothetical protein
MLLEHCIRLAASRAACTAGNRRAISTPIIAITTRSSTNVKPNRAERAKDKNFVEKQLKNQLFPLSVLNFPLHPAPPPLSCPF